MWHIELHLLTDLIYMVQHITGNTKPDTLGASMHPM